MVDRNTLRLVGSLLILSALSQSEEDGSSIDIFSYFKKPKHNTAMEEYGEACNCGKVHPFHTEMLKPTPAPLSFEYGYQVEAPKSPVQHEHKHSYDYQVEVPNVKPEVKLGSYDFSVLNSFKPKEEQLYAYNFELQQPKTKPALKRYEYPYQVFEQESKKKYDRRQKSHNYEIEVPVNEVPETKLMGLEAEIDKIMVPKKCNCASVNGFNHHMDHTKFESYPHKSSDETTELLQEENNGENSNVLPFRRPKYEELQYHNGLFDKYPVLRKKRDLPVEEENTNFNSTPNLVSYKVENNDLYGNHNLHIAEKLLVSEFNNSEVDNYFPEIGSYRREQDETPDSEEMSEFNASSGFKVTPTPVQHASNTFGDEVLSEENSVHDHSSDKRSPTCGKDCKCGCREKGPGAVCTCKQRNSSERLGKNLVEPYPNDYLGESSFEQSNIYKSKDSIIDNSEEDVSNNNYKLYGRKVHSEVNQQGKYQSNEEYNHLNALYDDGDYDYSLPMEEDTLNSEENIITRKSKHNEKRLFRPNEEKQRHKRVGRFEAIDWPYDMNTYLSKNRDLRIKPRFGTDDSWLEDDTMKRYSEQKVNSNNIYGTAEFSEVPFEEERNAYLLSNSEEKNNEEFELHKNDKLRYGSPSYKRKPWKINSGISKLYDSDIKTNPEDSKDKEYDFTEEKDDDVFPIKRKLKYDEKTIPLSEYRRIKDSDFRYESDKKSHSESMNREISGENVPDIYRQKGQGQYDEKQVRIYKPDKYKNSDFILKDSEETLRKYRDLDIQYQPKPKHFADDNDLDFVGESHADVYPLKRKINYAEKKTPLYYFQKQEGSDLSFRDTGDTNFEVKDIADKYAIKDNIYSYKNKVRYDENKTPLSPFSNFQEHKGSYLIPRHSEDKVFAENDSSSTHSLESNSYPLESKTSISNFQINKGLDFISGGLEVNDFTRKYNDGIQSIKDQLQYGIEKVPTSNQKYKYPHFVSTDSDDTLQKVHVPKELDNAFLNPKVKYHDTSDAKKLQFRDDWLNPSEESEMHDNKEKPRKYPRYIVSEKINDDFNIDAVYDKLKKQQPLPTSKTYFIKPKSEIETFVVKENMYSTHPDKQERNEDYYIPKSSEVWKKTDIMNPNQDENNYIVKPEYKLSAPTVFISKLKKMENSPGQDTKHNNMLDYISKALKEPDTINKYDYFNQEQGSDALGKDDMLMFKKIIKPAYPWQNIPDFFYNRTNIESGQLYPIPEINEFIKEKTEPFKIINKVDITAEDTNKMYYRPELPVYWQLPLHDFRDNNKPMEVENDIKVIVPKPKRMMEVDLIEKYPHETLKENLIVPYNTDHGDSCEEIVRMLLSPSKYNLNVGKEEDIYSPQRTIVHRKNVSPPKQEIMEPVVKDIHVPYVIKSPIKKDGFLNFAKQDEEKEIISGNRNSITYKIFKPEITEELPNLPPLKSLLEHENSFPSKLSKPFSEEVSSSVPIAVKKYRKFMPHDNVEILESFPSNKRVIEPGKIIPYAFSKHNSADSEIVISSKERLDENLQSFNKNELLNHDEKIVNFFHPNEKYVKQIVKDIHPDKIVKDIKVLSSAEQLNKGKYLYRSGQEENIPKYLHPTKNNEKFVYLKKNYNVEETEENTKPVYSTLRGKQYADSENPIFINKGRKIINVKDDESSPEKEENTIINKVKVKNYIDNKQKSPKFTKIDVNSVEIDIRKPEEQVRKSVMKYKYNSIENEDSSNENEQKLVHGKVMNEIREKEDRKKDIDIIHQKPLSLLDEFKMHIDSLQELKIVDELFNSDLYKDAAQVQTEEAINQLRKDAAHLKMEEALSKGTDNKSLLLNEIQTLIKSLQSKSEGNEKLEEAINACKKIKKLLGSGVSKADFKSLMLKLLNKKELPYNGIPLKLIKHFKTVNAEEGNNEHDTKKDNGEIEIIRKRVYKPINEIEAKVKEVSNNEALKRGFEEKVPVISKEIVYPIRFDRFLPLNKQIIKSNSIKQNSNEEQKILKWDTQELPKQLTIKADQYSKDFSNSEEIFKKAFQGAHPIPFTVCEKLYKDLQLPISTPTFFTTKEVHHYIKDERTSHVQELIKHLGSSEESSLGFPWEKEVKFISEEKQTPTYSCQDILKLLSINNNDFSKYSGNGDEMLNILAKLGAAKTFQTYKKPRCTDICKKFRTEGSSKCEEQKKFIMKTADTIQQKQEISHLHDTDASVEKEKINFFKSEQDYPEEIIQFKSSENEVIQPVVKEYLIDEIIKSFSPNKYNSMEEVKEEVIYKLGDGGHKSIREKIFLPKIITSTFIPKRKVIEYEKIITDADIMNFINNLIVSMKIKPFTIVQRLEEITGIVEKWCRLKINNYIKTKKITSVEGLELYYAQLRDKILKVILNSMYDKGFHFPSGEVLKTEYIAPHGIYGNVLKEKVVLPYPIMKQCGKAVCNPQSVEKSIVGNVPLYPLSEKKIHLKQINEKPCKLNFGPYDKITHYHHVHPLEISFRKQHFRPHREVFDLEAVESNPLTFTYVPDQQSLHSNEDNVDVPKRRHSRSVSINEAVVNTKIRHNSIETQIKPPPAHV